MRTLTTTIAILAAAAALFGSALLAQAKGPFRVEVSGGDLAAPVTIDGPLQGDIVFGYDSVPLPEPRQLAPAYTLTLIPQPPDGDLIESPAAITMTYFPGDGNSPALLQGNWEPADRYFQVTPEFQAVLDAAISSAESVTNRASGDDGVSAVWYIAPSLAAVGLMLIGGLAGRRLLFRHDE